MFSTFDYLFDCFFISIYYIISYLLGHNLTTCDVLNSSQYKCCIMNDKCGLWPWLHFLFYVILGFLYPQCFILLMIVGLFWEGIETIGHVLAVKYTGNKEQWIHGSLRDITYNVTGYLFGLLLAILIRKVNV